MSQKVKDFVRMRDGNRCVECRMTSAHSIDTYGVDLDVHRLVPGSAYSVIGCITLCKACHATKPKYRRNDKFDVSVTGFELAILDAFCDRHNLATIEVLNRAIAEYIDRYGHLPAYEVLKQSQLWPDPPKESISYSDLEANANAAWDAAEPEVE